MTPASPLPPLDADEREHEARVRAALAARIAAAGGWIDFADFMRFVLYEPGLGYYSAGARKFGAAGDFITAPELGPLFGACIARQVVEILERCGGREIVEFGAGSGALAVDVLRALAASGVEVDRYSIIEVSADLRERQQAHIESQLGPLAARVRWLDGPPGESLRGVMLANEVLDAMPVERFRVARTVVEQLGIALKDGEPVHAARAAPPELAARVASLPLEGAEEYESEICPSLPAWIASATQSLAAGVLLVMDYGLPRSQYYHPDRRRGSLVSHYRHRAHEAVLERLGLQDLTAWVDFTAVAEAADAAGLEVLGFTTQAQFLLGAGLEEAIAALVRRGEERTAILQAANRLLLPGDMGEVFKVMALGRGVAEPLAGFRLRDLRHSL